MHEPFRQIIEGTSDVLALAGRDGVIRYVSSSVTDLAGYAPADLIGKNYLQYVHPEDTATSKAQFDLILANPGKALRSELRFLRKDGTTMDVESVARNMLETAIGGIVVELRDLSLRRGQDEVLRRKTRALTALSASNAAVIHANSEEELLRTLCHAIVDVGGYRLAWFGWLATDGSQRILPLAWAGKGADYLEHADIRADDSERGHGPTGRCIRTGVPQVAQDIQTDPAMAPWRARAQELGYRSSAALPIRVNGNIGTLNIYATEPNAFDAEELALLQQVTSEFGFGLSNLRIRGANAMAAERVERSMEATVTVLAGAAEMRDPYTAGHQRRVAEIAAAIARELGLPAERVRGLKIAASLHDIGKIQVPAEILSCPRRLTAGEFEVEKAHAEAGYQLLKNVEVPWPVAAVIRQHHERLDGSGYPLGIKGDEIILEARIVGVADVLEAIASHRPYRPALGIEPALEVLTKGRGREYDPLVVDALVRLIREKGYVIPS